MLISILLRGSSEKDPLRPCPFNAQCQQKAEDRQNEVKKSKGGGWPPSTREVFQRLSKTTKH